MKKRRIALVTQDMANGGGVCTMTAFLHSLLKESGEWEPEIIALATSSKDAASTRLVGPATWHQGVRVESRQWRKIPYRHVGAQWVELEPQRYQPRRALDDILHEFDVVQFVMGSAAPVGASRRVRKPRLLWVATTVRADRASRLATGSPLRRTWAAFMTHLAERAERKGLAMSDFIFALSSYTLDALSRKGVEHKMCLAPCGVDTAIFKPGARDQDYIICVARLFDARKNVQLLLRAYALLCGRRKPCPRLFLVGEPPTEEAMRMLRDLGISGLVEMIGLQPPIKLAELYRGAKLFVLSSDEEGLGIVILEAMASGLPVVSTACGGPNMLITDGENGFLTPVGDAEALAGALDRVLGNPVQAERMGRNARAAVERSYSKPAIGAIFLEQYRKIIATTAS